MMKLLFIVAAVSCLSLFQEAEARGRIFYGESDNKNDFKYYVAILKTSPKNKEPQHLCGGAIIEKNYVITAAHCVYDLKPKQLLVRSGFLNTETGLDTTTYRKVSKFMYPKTYFNSSCRAHENDIAILKMTRNFDLADDDKHMKLYLPEYDTDYEDSPVILTGYGTEKIDIIVNKTTNATKNAFRYPSKLKFFESTIMPLEECKKLLPITVTEDNICTNFESASGFSCQGDSGGPLVYDKIIVGIRNKNQECTDDQPELFTRVSSFLGFIHNVLRYKFSYDITYVK